jgi:hypothetical protein
MLRHFWQKQRNTCLGRRFKQTFLLELLSTHGWLFRLLLDFFAKIGGDGQAGNGEDEAGKEDDALVVGDPIDVKTE